MSERLSPPVDRFAEAVLHSYPPAILFLAHHTGPEVTGVSNPAYRKARRETISNLLNGQPCPREYSSAIAFESLVSLSLQGCLEQAGFRVRMSPQSLELSDKRQRQKGVDLLITDTNDLVYMGIDVKMRRGHSTYDRDGHGWNRKTLSPFFLLSLGNHSFRTREQADISITEWLEQYAIPKIGTSGKIPHLDQFRNYLLKRIEHSVFGYVERLREPELFSFKDDLPETNRETTILEEKLEIMHSLFVELRQNL